MTDADKSRFVEVLRWFCRKYPVDGKPRPLPSREDLAEYFSALRDLPIEQLEAARMWHYGHSEFYPSQPAALRRSVEAWRSEQPPQASQPIPSRSFMPDWIDEAKRKTDQRETTDLGQKMAILFDDLINGRIDQEEHTQRLQKICADAGVSCD